MLTFKGKVRSMDIDAAAVEPKQKYHVSFYFSDQISIGESTYGLAYDDSAKGCIPEIVALPIEKPIDTSDRELFDFISQHSKELLWISYEKSEIKKVMLSYEL